MTILKNISYLFTAQVVNLLIGFVTSIYTTRILGAEGRGVNTLFTNSLNFATIFFGFSVTATIIYFINTKKISLERLLTSLLLFCFISTILVLITLFALREIGFLHLALPENFQSWKYIALFCGLHFSALWTSIFVVILNAYKVFKLQSLLSVAPTGLSLIIYIYTYYFWFQGSVQDIQNAFNFVLLITLGTSLLNFLIVVAIYVKEINIFPVRNLLCWSELSLVTTFSLLAYAGNILQFLSYRLDFWFVDNYLGKTQLGIYSLATQLAQLVWILPNAIAGILYSYASSESKENAKQYTASLATVTLMISVAVSLAQVFALYFTLTTLYGSEFSSAMSLTVILMFGTVLLSPAIVIASYFASQGKYKINLYGTALGTLSCFILYPILIKNYDVYGAAIASNITYFLNFCVLLYFAKKDGISFLKTTVSDLSIRFRRLLRRLL